MYIGRLPNPSPNSPQLQSYRHLLTWGIDLFLKYFCDDLVGITEPHACLDVQGGGCVRGDVPPSVAGKFCIFETWIVQFGEYF